MAEPKWSYERPRVEGWYWYQLRPGYSIALFWGDAKGLSAAQGEPTFEVPCSGGRWCGPIAGPDPAEPWPEGGAPR